MIQSTFKVVEPKVTKIMKIKSLITLFLLTAVISAQTASDNNKYRLAQSYQNSGKYEKAENILEELYNKYPNNNRFWGSLNDVYIQLKKYDKSINLLRQQIKQSPNNIQIYGKLGTTYYIKGDNQKAFETWEEGINTNPDKPGIYRAIANYAINNRVFDKAVEYLQRGKDISNDPYIFSLNLANIYSVTMKYKKAADEYCSILDNDEKQLPSVRSRMNNYLTSKDAVDQTLEVVNNYWEETEKVVYLKLLKYLYIQNENYEKAYEAVKTLDEETRKNGAEIFQFAREAYQDSRFEIASSAYKKVMEDYSNSPFEASAKFGFARTMEAALNKKESSADNWKPYNPNVNIDTAKYSEIIEAYRELSRSNVKNTLFNEALYRIGVIKFNKFNALKQAKGIFSKVASQAPFLEVGLKSNLMLSRIAIKKGNLDSAQAYLKEVLDNRKAPEDLRNQAVYTQARIAFWSGEFGKTLDKLDKITSKLSDDYANNAIELSTIVNTFRKDSTNLLKYAKADFQSEKGEFQKAAKLYKEIAYNEDIILLNDIAKYKYAEVLLAMDDISNATAVLKEITNSENETLYSDNALFLLANTYNFALNDKKSAIKAFQKLLEKFPNSLYFDESRKKIINLEKST